MNISQDWQIVMIGNFYNEEVDCDSGVRRRVWRDGRIEILEVNDAENEMLRKSVSAAEKLRFGERYDAWADEFHEALCRYNEKREKR